MNELPQTYNPHTYRYTGTPTAIIGTTVTGSLGRSVQSSFEEVIGIDRISIQVDISVFYAIRDFFKQYKLNENE